MKEFVHKGTVTLETKRLILRKFKSEDLLSIYNNWMSSEEVAKYFNYVPHKNIEDSKLQLERWIEENSNIYNYSWAIVLKEIDEPIGSISFGILSDKNFRTEVSCIIGDKYWNKGIATEALKEIIKFAFEELGINRIEARHLTVNAASGKVLKKAGMKHEGCMRERMFCKGTFYDSEVYSIIRSDLV